MHDFLNRAAILIPAVTAVGAVASVIVTFLALQYSRSSRQRIMTKEGLLPKSTDVEESSLSRDNVGDAEEPDEK
jgi:hypothetical protein